MSSDFSRIDRYSTFAMGNSLPVEDPASSQCLYRNLTLYFNHFTVKDKALCGLLCFFFSIYFVKSIFN